MISKKITEIKTWLVFSLVTICAVSAVGAGPSPTFVPVQGHIPAAAVSRAQEVGRLSSNFKLSLAVALKLRNQVRLEDLIRRLHDPKDPQYGRYLSPTQFAESFAPSVRDYNQVVDYLTGRGLKVVSTHSNHLLIEVEGSAAQVENAFQVELHQYRKNNGHMAFAPKNEPLMSQPVAAQVAGIVGLNNFAEHASHWRRPVPGIKAEGNGPDGGFSPSDIKSAYGLSGLSQNGTGESLALFELDGYTPSDITGYTREFGITNPPPLQNILVNGASGAAGSGAIEVTLDIELMMAVAAGASKILVYEGPNSDAGVIAAYTRIATDNIAREISTSWGSSESESASATLQAENSIFMQMASQGQSIFAAAGDSGAYDNGTSLSVDDPASQPYVVGVGGTTLTLSAAGEYESESAWSEPASNGNSASGGGGGISSTWSLPTWQSGLNTTANMGSTSKRMVPDVSLDANPNTGYAIYYQGQFTIIGGTSCAAPIWASFAALVNQARLATALSPLGFANPAIYQAGISASYNSEFHDIADGSTNLHYPAVTGYDLATGWGSFNGVNLLAALSTSGSSPMPTPSATPVSNPTPIPTPMPTPIPMPTATPPQPPFPPPSGSTAPAPVVDGRPVFQTTNPYQTVVVQYNVASVSGTVAVYIEVSKPGATLTSSNGTLPDPNHLLGFLMGGVTGQWDFVPSQVLPTWGVYQIRLIPLNAQEQPLRSFSNPAQLVLTPP